MRLGGGKRMGTRKANQQRDETSTHLDHAGVADKALVADARAVLKVWHAVAIAEDVDGAAAAAGRVGKDGARRHHALAVVARL